MTAVPQPENVRQLVVRTFEDFGARARTPWDLKETILIDEGKCMARSYRLYGYMAMWLVESTVSAVNPPSSLMGSCPKRLTDIGTS